MASPFTTDVSSEISPASRPESASLSAKWKHIGLLVGRYGIVLLLVALGSFKWNHTEAQSIQNWVSHSPFLSWTYQVTDLDGASRIIGAMELVIALLIALRRWSPLACFVGSVGAVGMFVTTLSFLFTTPGAWVKSGGMLLPSADSWFLVKDFLLFAIAIGSAREAWRAAQRRKNSDNAI